MKKIFTLIAFVMAAVAVNAQTLFSMEIKQEGITVPVLGASNTPVDLADYATITGGKASVVNAHSDAKNMIVANTGKNCIDLGGSGKSYVQIDLDQPLQAGDKLSFTAASGSAQLEVVTKNGSSASGNSVNGVFTMTSSFEGLKTIYVQRGDKPKIVSITIFREGNKVKAAESSVEGTRLTLTTATEGAKIYYGTASGAEDKLYTGPITATETTTYYIVAKKDGMDDSDEVMQKVVVAYGKLAATIVAPTDIAEGGEDEDLDDITVGDFVLEKVDGNAVLANSAPWSGKDVFKGLFKVKGNLTITNNGSETITSIKVLGISNNDTSTSTVTIADCDYTNKFNILPNRSGDYIGEVVFTPLKEQNAFTLNFPSQSRVKIEVYTGTFNGINEISAASAASKVQKVAENGQLLIKTVKGTFNVVGARVK